MSKPISFVLGLILLFAVLKALVELAVILATIYVVGGVIYATIAQLRPAAFKIG